MNKEQRSLLKFEVSQQDLENLDIRRFTKDFCLRNNIEFNDNIRRTCHNYVTFFKIHPEYEGIVQETIDAGIDPNKVKYGWYKSKRFSLKFDVEGEDKDYSSIFRSICEKVSPIAIKTQNTKYNHSALSIILSDLHIGLDIDPKYNMFGHTYNKEIYLQRIEQVKQTIIDNLNQFNRYDMFVLKILGDAIDGYNKRTTRGGHELQQNMSDLEMFETYVTSVVDLMSFAIEYNIADRFRLQLVSNDNHGGSFAEISNTAIKMLLTAKYPTTRLKVDVLIKFIEQFSYGRHEFLLLHGKDSQFQFKGLSLNPTDKDYKFLENYIRYNNISDKKEIHVIKGDLHQFNLHTNSLFDYENIGSFAPPSNWASHNFANNSKQGFTVHNVEKEGSILRRNIYFD